MNSFVDFEVLRSGKDFAASGERAWKRFFTGVDSDMVDQLVFGFEGSAFADTVFPEAGVIRDFRSADMFHRKMSDNFVKGPKDFTAWFLWNEKLFGVYPHTRHLLLQSTVVVVMMSVGIVMVRLMSHVSEESSVMSSGGHSQTARVRSVSGGCMPIRRC